MENVDLVIKVLKDEIKGSSFIEMKDEWFEVAGHKYKGMPKDLIYLYKNQNKPWIYLNRLAQLFLQMGNEQHDALSYHIYRICGGENRHYSIQ